MSTPSANAQGHQCPLCDGPAEVAPGVIPSDIGSVICERCLKFQIENTRRFAYSRISDRHLLSGLTREHYERHCRQLIIPRDEEEVEELKRRAPRDRDVQEKAKRFLLGLERMTDYPGDQITCDLDKDCFLGYCRSGEELRFLLGHLSEQDLIQTAVDTRKGWTGRISAHGWATLETYKAPNIESDKVFVAMWFNPEMDPAYAQGIKLAIEDDCGYTAIKIDTKEFLGDIVDEIIAEIRESRFVVADFTGQRHGVYYEAGYARGMGLPVISTCRNDEIEKLHFDTSQQNHIDWKTPGELRERLANRIRAVIGLGPHKKQREAP